MWGIAAALFQQERREGNAAKAAATAARSTQAPGATAALRAFARFPHLRPSAETIDAHILWLASNGASIDDADDIAESYRTMCELAGWGAETAATHPASDAEPEPAATPIAIGADRETTAEPIVLAPSHVKHEPAYAAQAFVDWCRVNGHCGAHKAPRIGELYAEHCREEGLVPLPTKTFRPALLAIPGVRKGLNDDYPAHLGNRRHRPTIWVIEPLTTVSDELPWSDLPRRVAA